MRQIIHVVRKDLRRFWPEAVITIVLLALFVRSDAREWNPAEVPEFAGFGWSFWLPILLLLSYVLLTVRVVQDEALVGDRQFWITRPYNWGNLLAAKVLFLLLAVNLPLLLSQLYLLHSAGFPITPSFTGLLWWHVRLLAGPPILIGTLAVLTRDLTRAGLALLSLLLTGAGFASFVLWRADGRSSLPSNNSFWDGAGDVLIVTALLGAIVWQYARRRRGVALALIAAGVVAYVSVGLATPERDLIARTFPPAASGTQPLLHLSLGPKKPIPLGGAYQDDDKAKNTELRFQLLTSDRQPIQAASEESLQPVVEVKGFQITVESPGEKAWDSGWVGAEDLLPPGESSISLYFSMKRALFDRIRTSPVKIRVALALNLYEAEKASRAVISLRDFSLEDAGRCFLVDNSFFGPSLHCRVSFNQRGNLLVRTMAGDSTCKLNPRGKPITAPGTLAWAWHPGTGSGSVSPVTTFVLNFSKLGPAVTDDSHYVCPGTPLIYGMPRRVRSERVETAIDGIRLEEYQVETGRVSGFGIRMHLPTM